MQPILSADAPVDPNSGYLSGQFSRVKLSGFGLVVKATDGSAEYVLPMGEDSNFPSAVESQTVVMKLPPGTYRISQWVTYATLTKETLTRKSLDNSPVGEPFKVAPGTVLHLGRYDLGGNKEFVFNGLKMNFKMSPLPVTKREVQNAFATSYPKLADLPFQCLFCVDTVRQSRAANSESARQ
ncbi:hypothetical protein GTP91_02985 [Rugamonas sp. FT82W]|uniref:Uncharacterized protein n=1 Tax=Duganella vulcania TaxID=2692166 RepID=A0A845FY30_9BURK|nr:hypothetical protein [Duganella vulcania]MYM86140.1 hypothetical protein [Duganella vulcania]